MSTHAPSENSHSSAPKGTFLKNCFSSIIAIGGQINCITNATGGLDLLPGGSSHGGHDSHENH